MTDIRNRFDAAIGAAPPSAVDIDTIVAGERRRVRRRRGWLAVGASTAAVVGIATGLALAGDGPGGDHAAPAAASRVSTTPTTPSSMAPTMAPTTGPGRSPTIPPVEGPTSEPVIAPTTPPPPLNSSTRGTLWPQLEGALTKTLPGPILAYVTPASCGHAQPTDSPLRICAGPAANTFGGPSVGPYYVLAARTPDGGVEMTVQPRPAVFSCPTGPGVNCWASSTAAATPIYTATRVGDGGEEAVMALTERQGMLVTATAQNWPPDLVFSAADGPKPPITSDQLDALVEWPRLQLP